MSTRCKPAWALLGLIAGITGLVGTTPVKAQAPWADSNYRYRRPITISPSASFAVGDIVAYAFAPSSPLYSGKMRADGKDLKIVYYNGSANVTPQQVLLNMGSGGGRVLFAAPAAIAQLPYLTENSSAGTTDWNTILAATPESTRVTFTNVRYANDDADTNVTLPFAFPFKNGVSSQLGIATDGYLQPGGTIPGMDYLRYASGIDDPAKFPLAYVIGAWMADLGIYPDAGHTDRGVFYTADATRAIIRWKTTDTADTATVDMNFAVILKPDGTIRFVYGPTDDASGTMKIGVGVGNLADSIVTTSTTAYSGHADILYTQYLGVTGYWAYYGRTFDDGVTGRVAPSDPTKLVAYNFDDGTIQGWASPTGNTDPAILEAVSSGGAKVLHLQSNGGGGHPQVWAGTGQTTLLDDVLVYSRMSGGEMGIGARCGDDKSGYFHLQPGYGNQKQIIQRGPTDDYKIISNTKAFTVSGWAINMLKVTGTDAGISITGKGWNEGTAEPASWEVTSNTGRTGTYNSGTLGFTVYGNSYLDWVYATDPKAESTSTLIGDEEQSAGAGIITGTVRDKWYQTRQSGMRVVVTDAAGHTYLGEAGTNASGVYNAIVPNGTYVVTALGGGRSASATVTVSGGGTVTQDLFPDVVANGDCEVPTADGSQPDQWEHYWFGTPPAFYGLSSEQNHTPGGHWSMKVSGATADSTSVQTGTGRVGNQLFQHPIVPGCSYTLGFWVYFAQAGGTVRFRLRNNWPSVSPVIIAGGAPDPLNENKGGLDANGKVPVGQWYEVKVTWPYVVGGSANPLPIEYGLYVQGAAGVGDVYFDDVTLTATPVSLNQVVAKVVDDSGNPIPTPYLGEMRYGGKLFAVPSLGDLTGIVRLLTTTTTPITLAAWQGPINRSGTDMEQTGALVGLATATPVPYDPNQNAPTATVVVTRHSINVLGAATSTPIFGTSQWPAYLIDKRLLKTSSASPGDDTLGDSTNPADWVQVKRNPDNFIAGKVWDAKIDNEGNGWGSGGLRGILSSGVDNTATKSTADIPERYRTTTFEIDLGSKQTIDQLEFGYFFAVKKQRIWISDTPFTWNVELPDDQTVVNTTTDTASLEAQGFSSANKPWDSTQLNEYLIYRFQTPISGRYLRVRQDGAPFGDGHQILLEMRAMSVAAFPKPVTGRVVDATGTPIEGAFVGPFPNGAANNYVRSAADGTFTWAGAGYPTALYAHVEAKSGATYAATPFLAAGPYYVTPQEGGSNIGDMVVVQSGGNAMLGATNVVVSNDGNLGTETYAPGFCDPSEAGHDPSKLTDGLAGDANQWAAKPNADVGGNPCIGLVTTGPTYLRFGVESTLASAADIDEIDIYWFQNGYPAGYYVQTSSDNGTTWSTVSEMTNYAGNYNDAYPGDGLRVAVAKFPTRTGVNKIRVIFSTLSNRGTDADNEYIINEIVALKHVSTALTLADAAQALRIAGGLLPAPPAGPVFTRLDVDGDGKITAADAVKIDKGVAH